jgi:hypothetical protein
VPPQSPVSHLACCCPLSVRVGPALLAGRVRGASWKLTVKTLGSPAHCRIAADRATPAPGSRSEPCARRALATRGSRASMGWPWPVGRAEPGQALQLAGPTRPAAHCSRWAVLGYGPVALGLKRNPFPFPFRLNSSLNFENSYLFEYLSKINETSSVGFLISISIQ